MAMSEQSKRAKAAGQVISDIIAANRRGELSDALALGMKLSATAQAMKVAHQPGALKIVRDYADALGMDADILHEQVAARIYEAARVDEIKDGLAAGDV